MIFLLFLFIDIFCCLVVFAWKAIPSEARVTRDEVSGYITHMGETVWKSAPKKNYIYGYPLNKSAMVTTAWITSE